MIENFSSKKCDYWELGKLLREHYGKTSHLFPVALYTFKSTTDQLYYEMLKLAAFKGEVSNQSYGKIERPLTTDSMLT
ncbi:MAG: hypothetical protein JSV09_06010 [Thermoplasmata archaeon]|nr:MAG: hypothetical protein JSV09_06010 [Thermoplasmata archaeon]